MAVKMVVKINATQKRRFKNFPYLDKLVNASFSNDARQSIFFITVP